MEKENLQINLPKEHLEYLMQKSGADSFEKAVTSTISIEMLKNKFLELVPLLSESHKDEFRSFVAKKFRLKIEDSKSELDE